MKKNVFSILIILSALFIACEDESFDNIDAKKSIFSDTISAFEGDYLANQCNANAGSDIVSFIIDIEGEQVILKEFDGISVNKTFNISNGNISYEDNKIRVLGELVDNEPMFTITYFDNPYCIIDFTIRDLFRFKGEYKLKSVSSNEEIILRVRNLINGNVILESLNNDSIEEFFLITKDKIEINVGEFEISGKLENATPVFEAFKKQERYFQLLELPKSVGLKALANKKFVSSENGKKPIIANRDMLNSWEVFEIIQVDRNIIALKANNGKYVSSENGLRSMTANRNWIGAWEQFELEFSSDDILSLKANNGKYVSSENGQKPIIANRNKIGLWEKFMIVVK